MEGLYSCLDYFQSLDDPFYKQLQVDTPRNFPTPSILFTAGSAATGMYRGVKFYEAAVKATNGDLARDAVSAAMDKAKIEQGPGGGAEMVPGKMHCKMNMYIAQCKVDAGKTRYDVISKRQDGRSRRNAKRKPEAQGPRMSNCARNRNRPEVRTVSAQQSVASMDHRRTGRSASAAPMLPLIEGAVLSLWWSRHLR